MPRCYSGFDQKTRNFDIRFQQQIEAIENYIKKYDKEGFNRKLDKQMLDEIDRYMRGKISIEDLMKEKFPEPEWIIEDNT